MADLLLPVRLSKAGIGRYTVLNPLGRVLGEVYKYEQRYNLRRVLVVRGWKVMGDPATIYPTRSAAIEALVAEKANHG